MEQTGCDLILFGQKTRRKALYSKGWKALRLLVRMRSAVRICPAAPQKNLETAMVSRFFLFRVCGEQMTETATKTATGHKKNAGNRPGVAL